MSKVMALGGAGHIGASGVRELVRRAPDVDVVIADYNLEAARALAAEAGGRTTAMAVDANDRAGLVALMSGADAVISTVGPYYQYGEAIVRAAIEAGTFLVDVCDDGDAMEKQLALHDEAVKKGVTVVVGLGATPGATNIMAKKGADRLDRVDDVDTAWAWTAIDPKMTGPAIVEHYLHAVTGEVVSFHDGQWVKIPAVSNPKVMEFIAPIGFFEVSEVGHPEPVTIPRYYPGVKNVTNRGGVWPRRFEELAMLFKQLGLADTTLIPFKDQKIPAREVATRIILALPELAPKMAEALFTEVWEKYGEFGIEGVVLRTEVRGEKDGRPMRHVFGSGGPADKLTALPSVIGALMYLDGKIKGPGVFAPEGIVDPDIFFKEFTKDFPLEETTVSRIG